MTNSADVALATPVLDAFADAFGSLTATRVAAAPGRVNLIGDHTDYNGGFVLPMAIDRFVTIAFRPRRDRRLRALATAFDEIREADLDGLEGARAAGWMSYVAGMAWAMQSNGMTLRGLDLAIDSTVPVAAGLSSSAALELASARALAAAASLPWDPIQMARLGQLAENEFVGMNCGIMDQYVVSCARADAALLLDCRSLESRPVPIPGEAAVVVMDTGKARSLVGSEYNERRASCDAAVRVLARSVPSVRALRDVDRTMLDSAADRLDGTVFRRAAHVVDENWRPVRMAEALAAGDLQRAGAAMNDSHASLRDLYEVSSRELDLVTTIARAHPACFGARMTGAGFGGCAVALVRAGAATTFVEEVGKQYNDAADARGTLYVCRPVAGARVLAVP
jgi:galactokinase